jgi:ADP-heptose:LPS heptosyltransferase
MGLGGYLTWTAAAREICDRVPGGKVLPVEMHGQLMRPIVSEIFYNNPRITQKLSNDNNQYCIPMILNNPSANYCKHDYPTHAVHRYDKHIIEQICEVYGITDPKLKCELYLTEEEIQIANLVGEAFGNKKYVVIEPQSNDEYSINKVYPVKKWQKVADDLNDMGLNVVQVGRSTNTKKLKGVSDLTGQTTFRSAAAIIASADLFVSSEGGLMHAANAVETKSVIVYSGFISPVMTGYSENTNIWVGKDHGPCGMKTKCDICHKEMEDHNPNEIVESVRSALSDV